jgi:CDP-diacylglycerol---serine O-phosphatidyltransferase
MRSPLDAFDRRNLLTYVSLFCGIGALVSASMGRASWAGGAIAAAVIADTFDGRFAKLFSSDVARRRLGGELDSLADAIVFGAVPVACALLLTPVAEPLPRALLWTSACAYAACAITRLAFFNVTTSESQTGFVGIPVPVAALIWSSSLLMHPSAGALTAVLALTAIAMVAPLRIRRPAGLGLALFTCWPLAVLALTVLGF